MTTTPPRLGVAALRAPAASKEDYRSQAILKLHRPSSLDYRVRHKLPVCIKLVVLELPALKNLFT